MKKILTPIIIALLLIGPMVIAALTMETLKQARFSTKDGVVCGCVVFKEAPRVAECNDNLETIDFTVSRCKDEEPKKSSPRLDPLMDDPIHRSPG